ncbi:hypothetical protein Tco_0872695, partial [Tanacetum coccineum]
NSKGWNSGDDQLRLRWMIYLMVLTDTAESVRDAIGFEYCLASSSGWKKSHVLWAEIGESSLTGLELVQEMTDKVVLVKEKTKEARDHQKSYVDYRRKPLEFEEIVISLEVLVENGYLRFLVDFSTPLNVFLWFWLKFLFDELRGRVVNDVVTQLKLRDRNWKLHFEHSAKSGVLLASISGLLSGRRVTCEYLKSELEGKWNWIDPKAIEVVCLVFD